MSFEGIRLKNNFNSRGKSQHLVKIRHSLIFGTTPEKIHPPGYQFTGKFVTGTKLCSRYPINIVHELVGPVGNEREIPMKCMSFLIFVRFVKF